MIKEDFKINLQLFAEPTPEPNPEPPIPTPEPTPTPEPPEPADTTADELKVLKEQNAELLGLLKAIQNTNNTPEPTPTPEPVVVPKPNDGSDKIAEYLEKMEKQNEEKSKELENKKLEALKLENDRLQLEKVMNATITNKPYMKEFLEDNFKNGIINNVDDLNFYTSAKFDKAFAIQAKVTDELLKAGQDPDNYITGSILSGDKASEIAEKQRAEKWKRDYARRNGYSKVEY